MCKHECLGILGREGKEPLVVEWQLKAAEASDPAQTARGGGRRGGSKCSGGWNSSGRVTGRLAERCDG